MIESIRHVIDAIRSDLGQLDASLVAVIADERELPSLPTAMALCDLHKIQERVAKISNRIVDLARKPAPAEPQLFDESEVS